MLRPKLERMRPTVLNAYTNNLHVLQKDPGTYWREVEAAIMMSRFFRFHVSGDIVDETYLKNIVLIATRQPHCEILCFTKKYELVNSFLSADDIDLPPNLHIVFSAWVNLTMVNPFNLPVAEVRYKDGTCFARENAKECAGNCTDCAIAGEGCWTLKHGEQIVFNEH